MNYDPKYIKSNSRTQRIKGSFSKNEFLERTEANEGLLYDIPEIDELESQCPANVRNHLTGMNLSKSAQKAKIATKKTVLKKKSKLA